MKKLLSISLSLILILTTLMALPFNAFAVEDGDLAENLTINVKTTPIVENAPVNADPFSIELSEGYALRDGIMGLVVHPNGSSSAAGSYSSDNNYYNVTFKLKIQDSAGKKRTMNKDVLTFMINGVEQAKTTYKFEDESFGAGKYSIFDVSFSVNQVKVNGECKGFYPYASQAEVSAPYVEGQHAVFSGTSYPGTKLSITSTSANTATFNVGSQLNNINYTYEDHAYDSGKVTIAPTCKEDGIMTYTCETCGDTYTEDIHTTIKHKEVAIGKAVPATFKKAGKTAGVKCSVCGTVIEPQQTIKKLGAAKLTKVTKAKKAFTAKWKKVANVDGYQIQYATNKKFTKGKKTVTVKKAKTVSKKVSKLKRKKTYYVRIRAYKTINGKKQYSSWSKYKAVKTK